jgi:hypothetical protein
LLAFYAFAFNPVLFEDKVTACSRMPRMVGAESGTLARELGAAYTTSAVILEAAEESGELVLEFYECRELGDVPGGDGLQAS